MNSFLEEELTRVGQQIQAINKRNGWYDVERSVGDDISLIHSEVSELLEEIRKNNWHTKFVGDDNKPVGAASEAADIFIRLMDFCNRWGINLGAEVETKIEYNKTRTYRHGGKTL